MGKIRKLFLPLFILIITIISVLGALFLSYLLGLKNNSIEKVRDILSAFCFVSLSLTSLLLLDVYKHSISKVWYWIFVVGFGLASIYGIREFIDVYLRYIDSVIDRMYTVIKIVEILVYVHADTFTRMNRFVYLLPYTLLILIGVALLIHFIKNVNLPIVKLVICFNEETSNKEYTQYYNKNISLGFLYNTIP